jgi:hypothetical protein
MLDPTTQRPVKPPPSRLEGWLMKKLQGGGLKTLPRYFPLGTRGGRCPEQFARDLLVELRASQGNHAELERLKDDGRAFRSWAESAVAHASHKTDSRGSVLSRGFITG